MSGTSKDRERRGRDPSVRGGSRRSATHRAGAGAGIGAGASLRLATLDDIPALEALIARSARVLGAADYTPAQIEGALRGAFGVDRQLLTDGTYFVLEDAGELLACGGWSFRRTLFGGDARADRDASRLDPARDAARIRAFFVDPGHARQGLGARLLAHCEADARRHGFTRFELMSTLPGLRLYARCGYVAGEPVDYPLGAGLTIRFVPMHKCLPAGKPVVPG